ncbi:MAG: MoaD/ThiS family protein [Aigarchaeota archaeon]|nr:MoaD/ThiS family protein [Candidatus Pelearchaeum maunauluense]
MRVELLGHLRSTAGSGSIELELGDKVRLNEVLRMLPEELRRHVIDEHGKILPGLLILVNGVDVRTVGKLDIEVGDDDILTLIPAIHGGAF